MRQSVLDGPLSLTYVSYQGKVCCDMGLSPVFVCRCCLSGGGFLVVFEKIGGGGVHFCRSVCWLLSCRSTVEQTRCCRMPFARATQVLLGFRGKKPHAMSSHPWADGRQDQCRCSALGGWWLVLPFGEGYLTWLESLKFWSFLSVSFATYM